MNPGELILRITLIASLLANILGFLSYCKKVVRYALGIVYGIIISGISTAFLLLAYYQFHHVFQYAYVFYHTSTSLPKIYLLSSLWAGKEGSILTWSMINTWVGPLLWRQSQESGPRNIVFGVFSILNTLLISICYFSTPFKLLPIAPPEGMGLTPALQNPWMLLHPPLIFWGYSTMAALFSLTLANNDRTVNNPIHFNKWLLWSSLFLGAGILTGSIWAQQALGWGKYWSWDPMENVALISWLTLIALVHSPVQQKKRNRFDDAHARATLPFATAVCGALLVRSGILQGISSHTYGLSEGTSWLSILILFIVLCLVIWIFRVMQSQFQIHMEGKHLRKGILIILLYSFADIFIIATTLQVMGCIRTPKIFNLLSLFFAISSLIALLLNRNPQNSKKMNIPALIAHSGFLLIFLGAVASIFLKSGIYLIWSGGFVILLGNFIMLLPKHLSLG